MTGRRRQDPTTPPSEGVEGGRLHNVILDLFGLLGVLVASLGVIVLLLWPTLAEARLVNPLSLGPEQQTAFSDSVRMLSGVCLAAWAGPKAIDSVKLLLGR